jgi:hypothetical protein
MSEKDFTPEERSEIRAMMQRFKAEKATVKVMSQAPEGSSYCGSAGKFAVYLCSGVLTIVALLNFQDDLKQAYDNGIKLGEVAMNTMNAVLPNPGPRRDPDEYPRETALASNTAHPDHMSIIKLGIAASTTPPV